MEKIRLPKDVAQAFNYFMNIYKEFDPNDRLFMFFVIAGTKPTGRDHEILRNYARTNAIGFMDALLDGYESELSPQEEVALMLRKWVDEPYDYELSEEADTKIMAGKIINYLQQQKS